MPQRRNVLRGACLALAVPCAACTNSGNHGSSALPRAAGGSGTEITVGSFDFPESVLLAYLRAQALIPTGQGAR
jgi:hypothetical protein